MQKTVSPQRHHNTPRGPEPCEATQRQCKYGEHFPSQQEAESAFNQQMGGDTPVAITKTPTAIPREHIVNRPVVNISDEKRDVLNAAGYSTPTMYELDSKKSAGAFSDAITASAKDHKFGASVYVYPTEEYEDMRLFVSDDGSVGYAIKDDGDIVSVYSMPDSKYQKSVYSSILMATENGGTKLDCFDTVLPGMYEKCGFEETERLQWDDQYMPEGWDKETYKKFNNGEPDVVMMEFRGFKPENFR